MAEVLVLLNPLDVSRRRRTHLGDEVLLLDWVDSNEPALGSCERVVYVNGLPCTDPTYRTHAHDEVLVAFSPGTGAQVAYFVVQALVSAAIGFVLSKLFAPQAPNSSTAPSPSQVYGIAAPRNTARLGQPIPVIYGAVIATPDYAAQPYTYFENNEQYLHAIFCLGMGEHTVTEMMIGDSSAAPLPTTVAQWWAYLPADHQSKFGVIQTARGVRENVTTCSNVGDQELLAPNTGTGTPNYSVWYWKATNPRTSATPLGINLSTALSPEGKMLLMPQNPNVGTVQTATYRNRSGSLPYEVFDYVASDYQPNTPVKYGDLVAPPSSGTGARLWIGPFETSKPGQPGHSIECDFVFPGGLFTYFDDGSGAISPTGILLTIEVTPINDAGGVTGSAVLYDRNPTPIVNPPNTPQRFTYAIPVASGRYRVRVARISNLDGRVGTQDRVVWAGLKFALDDLPASATVYGNVTLVAVKLKATNGVAAAASGSIGFRATRRLAPLGTGTPVATRNPADAFVDILCANYGGARAVNADELDLNELTTSRAAWATHDGFNGIFDQASTVWEALTLAVQTVHAAPLPVGSRMSLIHDATQPVRAQLFTDANIVAGSLQVTAQFDRVGTPQGVRVNYRDPRTFSEAAYFSPPVAPDYTAIDLFGCTSLTVAQEHAALAKLKRDHQRKQITFTTELEGLNVLPGDRIGVQAGMVKWGQSARVVSVAGLTLTFDTALVWTPAATHAVQLRGPDGVPWRAVGVTQGASGYELVVPTALPPWAITPLLGTQEATMVAFGVQDTEVTEWTVGKVTPNGDTVGLECVNYDPAIYARTPAFTRRALLALDVDMAVEDA